MHSNDSICNQPNYWSNVMGKNSQATWELNYQINSFSWKPPKCLDKNTDKEM